MEYVGDTEFVIELLMVDVDVVDKLLFVMEVRIAWLSVAFDVTDDAMTLADDDTLCSDCNWFWDVLIALLLLPNDAREVAIVVWYCKFWYSELSMPRANFSWVDAVDIVENERNSGPFSTAADCCDVLCLATAAKAIGAAVGIIVVIDEDDVVIADDVCCCCCCCDGCDKAVAIDEFSTAEMDVVTFVLWADEKIAWIPDKFNWPVAEADDIICAWFLLGVEHTIDLFCNDDIVALFDVFRSVLLARTAVGLTG